MVIRTYIRQITYYEVKVKLYRVVPLILSLETSCAPIVKSE